MKKLFLLFFISLSTYGVTLEKFLSLPDGSMRLNIELDQKELKLFKDSNYFDVKKSFAIGNFTASAKGQEKIIKELEDLFKKIEVVDEALRKTDSSFNSLSMPKPHVAIYRLNEFVIGPDSKYFKSLDEKFKKLMGLKWKQIDGYEISKDFKTVKEYEGGKAKKASEFARDFYCKRDVCTYYGGGRVYR